MKKLFFGSAMAWCIIVAPASAATFLGDQFEGSYRFPRVQNATISGSNSDVSPVAQFTFATGRINPTARISPSMIEITFAGSGRYNQGEFNGILLRNLSRSNIAGFALDPTSTVAGFDQSRLSFTSNSLFFNFAGLSIRATDRISANVAFAETAVPEPGTWTLMILGIGLIGGAMRSARPRQSILSRS